MTCMNGDIGNNNSKGHNTLTADNDTAIQSGPYKLGLWCIWNASTISPWPVPELIGAQWVEPLPQASYTACSMATSQSRTWYCWTLVRIPQLLRVITASWSRWKSVFFFFSEFVFCMHVTTDKEVDTPQVYYGWLVCVSANLLGCGVMGCEWGDVCGTHLADINWARGRNA